MPDDSISNSNEDDDPSTPRKGNKTLPPSPHKTLRIPLSPWKPDNKEFWDPEVNFAWIDKHSPAKPTQPPGTSRKVRPDAAGAGARGLGGGPKLEPGVGVGGVGGAFPSAFSTTEDDAEQQRKRSSSPAKAKREQREARKAFDETKDAVARAFLAELDEKITGGRLGRLTEASGGLRTKWSNTLQTTAGRAHWKCRTVTRKEEAAGAGAEAEAGREQQHEAHIELASKVLTNESVLLNTVAHEFCHLAVFSEYTPRKTPRNFYSSFPFSSLSLSLSQHLLTIPPLVLHHDPHDKQARKPAAHGAEFKAFGRRCGAAFGHRGIEVTTRHSYDIEYKFAWRCGDCLTEVHRHSRSVDPRKHRCGRCRGSLAQIRPVPRGTAAADTTTLGDLGKDADKPKAKRQPSAWQEFLAREMKALGGAAGKGMTFEKKMEIVSGKWKVHREELKKQQQQQQQQDGVKSTEDKDKGKGKGKSKDEVARVTDGVKALDIVDLVGDEQGDGNSNGNSNDDDGVVEVSSLHGR